MRFAIAMAWVIAAVSAETVFAQPRYRIGPMPTLPVMSAAVGGGQVVLEVGVGSGGGVTAITPLRTTASFTELTIKAVREWRFVPGRRPASKVVVAAIFRPPTINSPTLGEPVHDIAAGSGETPFPLAIVVPPFPPRARDPGVVLVEAEVSETGAVVSVKVVHSAPPFDRAALDAARQWTFRPARVAGHTVRSFAYILFGFPTPIV